MNLVPTDYFKLLPPEILVRILSFIDYFQIGKFATVSKSFKEICYDEGLWRNLDLRKYSNNSKILAILNSILGKRSSQLQSLNISNCSFITDDIIDTIAKTCKNIKTLDISLCPYVSYAAIQLLPKTCKVSYVITLKPTAIKMYPDTVSAIQNFLDKKILYQIFALNQDYTDISFKVSAPYKNTQNRDEDILQFTQFVKKLSENICAYALYNFKYTDGSNKVVLLLWTPEQTTVKDKMVYSSVKNPFIQLLIKFGLDYKIYKLHAAEHADLLYNNVIDFIERYTN